MNVVNATEIKNCFGKYLQLALSDGEVLIKRHNKIVAKIVAVDFSNTEQLAQDVPANQG